MVNHLGRQRQRLGVCVLFALLGGEQPCAGSAWRSRDTSSRQDRSSAASNSVAQVYGLVGVHGCRSMSHHTSEFTEVWVRGRLWCAAGAATSIGDTAYANKYGKRALLRLRCGDLSCAKSAAQDEDSEYSTPLDSSAGVAGHNVAGTAARPVVLLYAMLGGITSVAHAVRSRCVSPTHCVPW